MADFLNRPLTELDQLYDFRGNQLRTQQVDLSGISLVHDVAPGAQQTRSDQLSGVVASARGQQVRGRFYDQAAVTAAGAEVLRINFDPWEDTDGVLDAGLRTANVDLWLISWGWSISADVTTGCTAVVSRHSLVPVAGRPLVLLGYGNATLSAPVVGDYRPIIDVDGSTQYALAKPIRLNFQQGVGGDIVAFNCVTTGAGTFRASAEYVVTPAGIAPSWIP